MISSGKGGVGQSSVTTNLAVALAQRGHSVGIIDADIYGHSIPRMLGTDRKPVELDGMLLPPEKWGVRCISIGYFVAEGQAVIWRGPMLHKALEQFLAAMAEKLHVPVKGVIENMSWFTADDGKRYELFGAGGGAQLDELAVPLLGQLPLVPALRQGATTVARSRRSRPTPRSLGLPSDRERVAVELRPRKIFNPLLKII